MNKLGKWQRVLFATFFGVLGAVLITLPFYLGGKEMVKGTGTTVEWSNIHYIFILAGVIFVGVSLKLSRIEKLFNISTGIFTFFANKKKSDLGKNE
ncbi:MAG: hypothetical protein AAF717_00395 [Bacteroidota bacterium]